MKSEPYPGFSEDVSGILANIAGLGFFDSPEQAEYLIGEAPEHVKPVLEELFNAALEISDFASFEDEDEDHDDWILDRPPGQEDPMWDDEYWSAQP